MTGNEKILNFAIKNNGYICSKDLKDLEVNRTYLSNLVVENKLEKIGRGIYKLPEYPIDNMFILSKSSSKMCYSHETALYLHNLSDRVPLVLDVTVPYNYNGLLINNSDVSLRYVSDEIFKIGLIEIETELGNKVQCYDLERTICDIIKDKNKIDREIYSKALKQYSSLKNKDLFKLIKYSKKLNIEEEVVELMEVLL